MERVILLLSTLDTKGPETLYLRDRIRENHGNPLILDLGMSRASSAADIPAAEVAQAVGANIEAVRASRDGEKSQSDDGRATRIAGDLLEQGRLAGVIGLGGSTGSLMATDVMRSLPWNAQSDGVVHSRFARSLHTIYRHRGYSHISHGNRDCRLDQSPQKRAEKGGCRHSRHGRSRSAHRGIGAQRRQTHGGNVHVGPTEKCAHHVRQRLEMEGFEVIGFSAAGVCDRAMKDDRP